MALENDKIKDLFSSKLNSFEPEVPASLWGGLDQLLSQQPPQAPVDASSSSASGTSSTSSASSTSTVASTTVVKSVLIAAGVTAAITTAVLIIPSGEENLEPEAENIVMIDDTQDSSESLVDSMPTATIPLLTDLIRPSRAEEIFSVVPEENDIKPVEEHITDNADSGTRSGTEKIGKKEEIILEDDMLTEADEVESLALLKLAEGLSLSFKTNMGLSGNNIQHEGIGELFSRDVRSPAFIDALKKENNGLNLQHDLPISFGVIVGKQLTARLSVETGVVYTHLSSKIVSCGTFGVKETQKFNYLGIPINLNYTFYKLGRTNIYVSAGAMVQKDVSGSYTSEITIPKPNGENVVSNHFYYTEPYFVKNSISQSNLQFSAHTALGISYPIYKKLYIYGTVGAGYYFDAGNKYRTIYSDRPTQLNVTGGLKFDF